MAKSTDIFFAGWGKIPDGLRWFLYGTGLGLIALFALFSYLMATTQTDPGPGRFAGGAQATGIMQAKPYPVVHIVQSNRFERGAAIILSGGGKRGVQSRADPLDGQIVQVQGARIQRGTLDAMQLRGGRRGLQAATDDGSKLDLAPIDLGRWRISGEICDGKCYLGAMRPGDGIAHKACANLCLIGGVPPVFVTSHPVAEQTFFLLGNQDGGPLSDEILNHVAALVSIEGRVEKRGSLHLFLIDPETIELVQ